MKIILVGCGKVGTTILDSLLEEGHDMMVVDSDPAVIEETSNIYDTMCVCGNGCDCEVLTEAGAEDTDLIIAATGSDEMNMLSCFLAKRMGAKHSIARIRNPEYNDQSLGFLRHQLDLSLAINPDRLAASELFRILRLPAAINIETFSRRNFEMIEILLKPDSILDGLSLMEMRKKYQAQFLVSAVQRGEEVFIPGGNFVLRGGDRIGITAKTAEIVKLLKMLGLLQKQAKNVMILGGSRTTFYLAKMLLGSGCHAKIIDVDPEKCREFSDELNGAVVICGDGAQQELLMEEGIGTMDAFVSLTGMDEENLLISFFASSKGVPKVITKINRAEYFPMAEKLGLDSIVSPRKTVSDMVLRYTRALQNSLGSKMETLYRLMDDKVEALEFNVLPDFEWTDIELKDLKLKPNILIAGIIRDRTPLIPKGSDKILAGDKVVVFAGSKQVMDLADIMQ